MNEADCDSRAPARSQLIWFLACRVSVITLFLGGTILYRWRMGEGVVPSSSLLFQLIGISYIQTAVSALLLPRLRCLKSFKQAQIVWDLIFASCLIYVTGGIGSPFSFIYILVIISASVFLSRKEVIFVASAAVILYGSLLDLQFYGYLPRIGHYPPYENIEGNQVFYSVFLNVIAFFLTAFLSGTASERLRRSETALEKRQIDYDELESLNRTILANITSGLMIVNAAGRIRSFNAAASKITGYTLEEIYDRQAGEVFPSLQLFAADGFAVIPRGETHILNRQGQTLVFGYASSPLQDPQGNSLGLLITFQDLTHLKKIENQLKRADRLAAVGRLASGMAHEIRNPLASISGSVQLLMENPHAPEEDRKLMSIVVKEANRLSRLLTDFLVFARPQPPSPAPVDISEMLDDLAGMLAADPRFARVDICKEYPARHSLYLDRQQMHQALWNLVINAVEAMGGEGRLYLGAGVREGIYVEDTGQGIPEEIRDRIFDPFFTTKDWGTGLGLATVYAIVDGHGGRIEATMGRRGGAKFVISLPQGNESARKN